MKNDITYEYRVFTNRIIDVESMEVGKCTSKVIKEIKQKDKVDGRFFHTSDTDEWFFCWNGKLQKLNLKGDADVNAALDEVRELIKKAETSVDNVNKIAQEAKSAAADAKDAADKASVAAGKIEDKADKSDVEAVEKEVELKADKSIVEGLSDKVYNIESLYATKKYVDDKVDGKFDAAGSAAQALIDAKASAANLYQVKGNYLTEHQDISGKQDVIDDLDNIRANAELAKTALQEIPEEYVTEEELAAKGYITSVNMDGKQDVISDLEEIRSNAKNALKSVPDEYVTETELESKGYLTEHQSLDNYYTKEQIDAIIGVAIEKTNTILNA